jgi:hypothetical protein
MANHVIIDELDEPITYTVGGTPQSEFAIPFPFFAASDIIVYVDDELVATADYTVEGLFVQNGDPVEGAFGSGTVTLDTAVSNVDVKLDRFIGGTREDDFSSSAPLSSRSVNSALDKLTARDQDLRREFNTGVGGAVTAAAEAVDSAAAAEAAREDAEAAAAIAEAAVPAIESARDTALGAVESARVDALEDIEEGRDEALEMVAAETSGTNEFALTEGYQVTAEDRNRFLVWASADDLDLTVADDLPNGFFCCWLQAGPGIIHFEEEGGGFDTYLKHGQGFQDTAREGAFGVIIKIDGVVWLSGDMA